MYLKKERKREREEKETVRERDRDKDRQKGTKREGEGKRQRENYLRIFQRPAAHKTTSLFIQHIKPTIPNSKYILKII